MAKYIDLKTLEPLDDGDIFIQNTMTNADRIRGMTDEELAEILARSCPDNDVDRDYCGLEDGTCDCVCCWFEWLEADDGDS